MAENTVKDTEVALKLRTAAFLTAPMTPMASRRSQKRGQSKLGSSTAYIAPTTLQMKIKK
jgi:hypothetical protein